MKNNPNTSITLTFFTLADLVAELRHRNLGTVRYEAITRDSPSDQAGPWRKYVVMLTAHDHQAQETLVCAILVGEGWVVFAEYSQHAENLLQAKEQVLQYLANNGLWARPGVYQHQPGGYAQETWLWRFDEQHRLIPNRAIKRAK